MRSGDALGTRKSGILVSRPRKTGMSGCGSIRAVSTSEAAQSCQRPLIPCIAGTKDRAFAILTSTISLAHPSPLYATQRRTTILSAGVVLAWVDSVGDDRAEGGPVLQQGLAARRRQEDASLDLITNHSSSTAYIDGWTYRALPRSYYGPPIGERCESRTVLIP